MFLKVTNVQTGTELYINIDNVRSLIPAEDGSMTLIVFNDSSKLLVEESIDDLLEDEE